MKTYFLFVLSFLFVFSSFVSTAQETDRDIEPLKIGDTIPDIVFSKMINYKNNSAKLSDFQGKAILLDFWATWCMPCIASFPKLEKFQREYKEDLQIILASSDKEAKLVNFYDNKRGLILPTATFNSKTDLLQKLFPHAFIPHYVWINKDRKIYAITDASYVDEENIEKFLNQESHNMITKTDSLELTDFTGSVIDSIEVLYESVKAISVNPNILYQSTISKYDPRLSHSVGFTRSGFKNRWLEAVNCSVAHLVATANRISASRDFAKIYYDLRDSTFDYPSIKNGKYEDWVKKYCYSYRLILHKPDSVLCFKIMQRDLEMAFGVTGTYRKMEAPCLVLQKISSENELLAKKGDKPFIGNSIYYIKMLNHPVNRLIDIFYRYHVGQELKLKEQHLLPIVDETGITENISIDISNIKNVRDLDALNDALNKVGLRLIPDKRFLEILVISDKT